MKNTKPKIFDMLNDLIDINDKTKIGYETAAQNVLDLNIRDFFLHISFEREDYSRELWHLLKNLDNELIDSLSYSICPQYSWGNFINSPLYQNLQPLLYSCAMEDNIAINLYTKTLSEDFLNKNIRSVISSQLNGIYNCLKFLFNPANFHLA